MLCMGIPTALFLLPLVAEFLSFYVFSGYHSDWPQEISYFPEDGAIAPVCGCSLAHQSWCIFLRVFIWFILAAAPQKCIRTWPQSRGDRSLAPRALGMPVGPVG